MARPSTPAGPAPTSRLTDDQLRDLLRLAKGADSIELKVSVPASGHRSALRNLDIDALNAQIRQVFFFDTPDLTLYNAGLNVRARRIQNKGEDSVVKIRPVEPDDLEAEWRLSPNMKVEVDAMPGGYVCSASLKGSPKLGDTRKVAQGQKPIHDLFSKEQRAFYAAHAPDGLDLDTLSVLGPIFVLKVGFTPEGLDRKITGEMWLYPDGRRVLELSTKCAPNETMQVATEARLYFSDRGIDLASTQETKTKSALQFFAKELKTVAPAGPAIAGNGTAEAADGESAETPADQVPVEVAAATDGEMLDAAGGAADGATGTDADPD